MFSRLLALTDVDVVGLEQTPFETSEKSRICLSVLKGSRTSQSPFRTRCGEFPDMKQTLRASCCFALVSLLLQKVEVSNAPITGIPRFTSLICSRKTTREAKTRKTKIIFPLLPEKRRREQRSVCERKELVIAKIGS
jgi:hypothetical protein